MCYIGWVDAWSAFGDHAFLWFPGDAKYVRSACMIISIMMTHISKAFFEDEIKMIYFILS